MAITKYSTNSSYVAGIYEDTVLTAREMNLMTGLVTNYSAQGWMTRTLPLRAAVTAVQVADGVDYANPTTFSKSTVATLTPNEFIGQILITDRELETDPDGARAQAGVELGNAIATKVDVDLVGVFSSLSADKGPGAGNSANLADFAVSVSVLRNNKTPAPIYIVAHPYHWHDIWIELGQPASEKAFLGDVANQAMRDYAVMEWLGSQWFVSANISVDASDDAVSGIFHRQAIALDSRRAHRLEPERDASLRALELNMTVGYAVGLGPRGDTWGVYYTADAAEPS